LSLSGAHCRGPSVGGAHRCRSTRQLSECGEHAGHKRGPPESPTGSRCCSMGPNGRPDERDRTSLTARLSGPRTPFFRGEGTVTGLGGLEPSRLRCSRRLVYPQACPQAVQDDLGKPGLHAAYPTAQPKAYDRRRAALEKLAPPPWGHRCAAVCGLLGRLLRATPPGPSRGAPADARAAATMPDPALRDRSRPWGSRPRRRSLH
jgi:hypothetical protein